MQTTTKPTLADFKAAYAATLQSRRIRDYGTGAGYDPIAGQTPEEAADLRAHYIQKGAPAAAVKAQFPTLEELETDGLALDALTVERMIPALLAGRASFSGNPAIKSAAAAVGAPTTASAFIAWLQEA